VSPDDAGVAPGCSIIGWPTWRTVRRPPLVARRHLRRTPCEGASADMTPMARARRVVGRTIRDAGTATRRGRDRRQVVVATRRARV